MIFNNFNYKVDKFYKDRDGRLIYVDITSDMGSLRLVTVYCPNNIQERKIFLQEIDNHLIGIKPLIIGGDWNCVENLKLDKYGGNQNKGSEGSSILNQLKSAHNLIDPFRILYNNCKSFTWESESREIKTRIDRFYITKSFIDKLKDVDNITSTVSDHYGVKLSFKQYPFNNFKINKSCWKMNTEILNDDNFVRDIELEWNNQLRELNIQSWEWWENCKRIFKDIAIKHSIKRNVDFHKQITDLELALTQIEGLIRSCDDMSFSEILKDEKHTLIRKIGIIYKQKYKGAMLRSKCKILIDNEQPNSGFLRIEAKNSKKQIIEGLKKSDNTLTTSTEENLELVEQFYKNLYKYETCDHNSANEFTSNLSQIPTEIHEYCETMITFEELSKNLKMCKTNVSPGSDGIPIEFYKKFWNLIGPTFTILMNSNFLNNDELSFSQKESMIRLICKNNNYKENLAYYRPISLLNSDYKLIAKTLSNRLKSALPHIINPNQTFGIPGRSIQDNLTFVNSLFTYIKAKDIPAIFLNIDQEKAFDRVSHDYLLKVMQSFGFGPNFLRWIKILYTNLKSRIIVNGYFTNIIEINRSVRQGCPIAPLLYICVIENASCEYKKQQHDCWDKVTKQ